MKKISNDSNIWYVICIVIGIVCFLSVIFIWRSYITAEVKLRTEATIIESNVTKKYKNNEDYDEEEGTSLSNQKYKPYYYYELKWEFTDEKRDVKGTFSTVETASSDNLYKVGFKKSFFIFSKNGEDYQVVPLMGTIILCTVGTVFIVAGLLDYFSDKKHKKKEDNIREVINQRIQNNSNIKNG